MKQKSPIIRLLLAIWLLSSQVAGGALVFAPLAVLLAFQDVASTSSGSGIFNFLLGLGYLMPLIFVGLGITAWVMFAKKRDALSGWLGVATLIPGAIMLLAMQMY